jgi:hypothetical protein
MEHLCKIISEIDKNIKIPTIGETSMVQAGIKLVSKTKESITNRIEILIKQQIFF